MSDLETRYSVLVIFGKEVRRTITSPDIFQRVVQTVGEQLSVAGRELKARGTIKTTAGKNASPRQARWSSSLFGKWIDALSQGKFHELELFDEQWSPGRHPDAYAGVYKLYGYDSRGHEADRTPHGAENGVVVALNNTLVNGAFGRMEVLAHFLAKEIDAFYGSIESDTTWDRRSSLAGSGREDMIDLRWHNRTAVDYRRGKYRMEEMVPRLYRGNLFSPSHFIEPNQDRLSTLPGVSVVENWPVGLTYVCLSEEPEYGAEPPQRFREYIRLLPPT